MLIAGASNTAQTVTMGLGTGPACAVVFNLGVM